MDMMSLIPEQLIILVVCTYLMGMLFKQVKYIKDFLIPILLILFAIIFSCALQCELSALAILQGILCWGVAVGLNQTYKQIFKSDSE